jgi:hypothetical protein
VNSFGTENVESSWDSTHMKLINVTCLVEGDMHQRKRITSFSDACETSEKVIIHKNYGTL